MAEQVVNDINSAGGLAISYKCDVSKEDEVVKMFQDVITQFGTVDILVNNAGLQRDAKFTEMTLEQWNFVFGVNLNRAVFVCKRSDQRIFKKRGKWQIKISRKNYLHEQCA